MTQNSNRRTDADPSDSSHLVDGKYSIVDLVDIERLRKLLERFSQATGFTTGFVSHPEPKILIATGWRDICTKFHRVCPASAAVCRVSNIALTTCLGKHQPLNIMPCGHGLADGATPVIVRGKHIASVSTGQVLLAPADAAEFRARARQFGFEEERYIAALSQMPVVSAERLRMVLSFLSGVAEMLAEQALSNLQLRQMTKTLQKEVRERKRTEAALEQSQRLSDTLIDSMPGIFYLLDRQGRNLRWNQALEELFGLSPKELAGSSALANVHERDRLQVERKIRETFRQGYAQVEARVLAKGGQVRNFLLTGRKVRSGRKSVLLGNGLDITERKRLEQALLSISEREQRRIALDLHDGLCQQLVGIAFSVEGLRRELLVRNPDQAKAAEQIGLAVDAVITDARRLSRGLHPVMAEANGLMSALGELADTVVRLFHVRCRFHCPKPVLLHDHVCATHLFRIGQEAVTNALKHSKASQVVISLSRNSRRVELRVRDNGTGLPEPVPSSHGLGMQTMNYRASMVGGTVQFRNLPRGGTQVSCLVPVPETANRAPTTPPRNPSGQRRRG